MKSAVITFPGSNCDRDMAVALERISGSAPHCVWHGDSDLPDVDLIAIPGGFSYGDYLRCGAIAARSPIIPAIKAAADRGVRILGVCNGFQILLEMGLLPGALMRNAGLSFICRDMPLEVTTSNSPFTNGYAKGDEIIIPIAHHDGNYFADADTLDALENEDRVAFRYAEDVNGSQRRIAGILNKRRTILGMMPHPERAVDIEHGGTDGTSLFKGLMDTLETTS